MALSGGLGRAGTPPERLAVSADVTFDQVEEGWRVVSSQLTVSGVVPGMSNEDFVAVQREIILKAERLLREHVYVSAGGKKLFYLARNDDRVHVIVKASVQKGHCCRHLGFRIDKSLYLLTWHENRA